MTGEHRAPNKLGFAPDRKLNRVVSLCETTGLGFKGFITGCIASGFNAGRAEDESKFGGSVVTASGTNFKAPHTAKFFGGRYRERSIGEPFEIGGRRFTG